MNVPQPTNRASVSRSFDSGSGHAVRNWSICILMCLLIMSVVCIGGGMVVNEIVKLLCPGSGHVKGRNDYRHINGNNDHHNYEYSTPDQNSADLQSEQGLVFSNFQGYKSGGNGGKQHSGNGGKYHGDKYGVKYNGDNRSNISKYRVGHRRKDHAW
eukprot:706601_1